MKRLVSIALSILLILTAFPFIAVTAEEGNAAEEEALKQLGSASDDAKLDYVIEAPETYRAGDDITVKVYVRNITAENGIHLTEFKLYYNNENLLLTNDIDEEEDNVLVCVEKAPSSWKENFSRVSNDYNEDNEEGTEVKPLNDGVIIASIFTDKTSASAAVKADDAVVFAFTFKALADAEDDLAFVIPHNEAEAALNTKDGVEQYNANGGYAVVTRHFTTEEKMVKKLGQAPEDAKLDFVIDAPEYYVAGEDITVTVTVKNITAPSGLHVVSFKLLYDNKALVLTNDLDEEDENAVQCIKLLPNGWENLSNVANDYNDENEEGTEVKPLNDGVINVNALTDKLASKYAITADDAIVFEFTFKALEDAKTEIGFVIPNASAEGALNTKDGVDIYDANGDYAIAHAAGFIEGSDPDCVNDGITGGVYCLECGEIIVAQEVIPALGHDTISHEAKAPTCTEIGWDAYETCGRCDYTTYNELEALGHDHKATVTAPTCTEKGYTTHTCHCGDSYVDSYVDALGHTEEWITTVEPDVGKTGWEELRCTVCGDLLDEGRELPALRLFGDINNSGEIDKYDYLMVKRAVMGTLTLDGIEAKAADVNNNGGIDKYDYLLIKRHVMGTYTIAGTTK